MRSFFRRGPDPSSPEFFEAKYRENADPWDFAHNTYELDRYDKVIDALRGRRYRRAFEPGCSVGVLTEKLATLCDAVEACDFSETAAHQARERCAALPQVTVTCRSLADAEGSPRFDLLVFSEVGYYFEAAVWRAVLDRLVAPLAPGSIVLGSHWLGESNDHRISGDEVHRELDAHPGLRREFGERYTNFRLDRYLRI